ncbi:hypothetical protein KKH59_04520, partial [Patescibacteria group bacterium]|nr:hypothetical protein [Patescibacteria group bacterium]
MPNGERNIARKIGEKLFGGKTEGKKEAISKRNAMIGEFADILKKEREDTFGNYGHWLKQKEPGDKCASKKLKEFGHFAERAQKAEKNFLTGNWNKDTINAIEIILSRTIDMPANLTEKRRKELIEQIKKYKGVSQEEITVV